MSNTHTTWMGDLHTTMTPSLGRCSEKLHGLRQAAISSYVNVSLYSCRPSRMLKPGPDGCCQLAAMQQEQQAGRPAVVLPLPLSISTTGSRCLYCPLAACFQQPLECTDGGYARHHTSPLHIQTNATLPAPPSRRSPIFSCCSVTSRMRSACFSSSTAAAGCLWRHMVASRAPCAWLM